MVITTYAIIMNECEKNGAVFRVKWRRIVVDEAHQIRNHKSQTSEAICRLAAESRWALTGTPVHNKELDMYALLKFLRCTPFDDLVVIFQLVFVLRANFILQDCRCGRDGSAIKVQAVRSVFTRSYLRSCCEEPKSN